MSEPILEKFGFDTVFDGAGNVSQSRSRPKRFYTAEEGAEVRAWETDAYWSDSGSLDELVNANLAVAAGLVDVDWAGELVMGADAGVDGVHPGATLSGPVLVGPGAVIEDGATVDGPCVIGPRAVIRSGARIVQSLVLPEADIPGGAEANGGILGDEAVLDGVWLRG